MIGCFGLRAILEPVSATDGAVLMDVSEVTEPSSASTCSNEEPGVPDGDPPFLLSVERFTIRGSEDVLEEACLGS
jgi:hypothetical protein